MSLRRDFFHYTSVAAVLGVVLLSSSFCCEAQSASPPAAGSAATRNPDATVETQNPEDILQEVVVATTKGISSGLMKKQTAPETMSAITPAAIQEKFAAASPLQLAATIPGANFGASDSFGVSVRNFLSVRGLDQTELGFLIENVPGIDMGTYFPYSESWADNENISDITLTPGNSRLQDPIISASGGEFIESIRAPRDTFGGMASVSGGSFGSWRAFGGIDTGYLGKSGFKAFLSGSSTAEGNYVGPGINTRKHVDFKAAEDWSDHVHSSLFVSYNDLYNARIPPLTLIQFNNAKATDNFEQYAYAAKFIPGVTTNQWKSMALPKTNYLVASNNDIQLNDKLSLHVTPYFRHSLMATFGEAVLSPTSLFSGNQLVTAVFDPADLQSGKLFTRNSVDYDENQAGVSTYLEANFTPSNHFMIGYWFERWHLDFRSYYNLLDQNGNPLGTTQSTALRATDGDMITGTSFKANATSNQVFVGDTQSLLDDKLLVSVGFKALFYSVDGDNLAIGADPRVSAQWTKLMPRFLISYNLNSKMQIYGNVTTNSRMPNVIGTYITQFNVSTGGATTVGNPDTKPEYSTGGQIGYRYHGLLNIDANAFYMKLRDHQVSSLQYINNASINTAISAGGESIRGASLEATTHSYAGFSVYGNVQYLRGTFDDDIPVGNDRLPTRGKQMVESPNWIASVSGRYEKGSFFAEVTGKYISSQFATFMNDQSMPGYETVDLTAGYHLPAWKSLNDSIVRVNLANLGNKSYISSVASATTNAVPTLGVGGTSIAGGTPSYYIAAPLTVMVTLSTSF